MPKFSHVIIILLENHEYSAVVGNKDQMPVFNQWLDQYASLTNYYAVTHPSLPNYLALIGGSTFDITSDCNGCFINAPSLPDQIEASQRTWKTYQENMPAPCYLGDKNQYSQHHDPFVYFDLIRKNPDRCDNYVVPMTQMDSDLSSGKLPDFSFIVPNICNDAHNCSLSQTDSWLKTVVDQIQASPSYDNNTLIAAIFDEGDTNATCCGLGSSAGGHVAAVLISPLVQSGFQDPTQYSHYSLLKTIEASWGLPYLGHAADEQTKLILAPWKK